MIDIQAIILEIADEWDSLEHQDMDTPAAHAVALATEVAQRAVLAEREACAKVCDAKAAKWRKEAQKHLPHHNSEHAKSDFARAAICDADAAAIRLRSNAGNKPPQVGLD